MDLNVSYFYVSSPLQYCTLALKFKKKTAIPVPFSTVCKPRLSLGYFVQCACSTKHKSINQIELQEITYVFPL